MLKPSTQSKFYAWTNQKVNSQKKMAKIPNQLYHPVPKLQEYFTSVYMHHNRETSKQEKEIEFKKLILDVATNWRFQNFVDFVESESDDCDDIILEVCHYMMTLLVKILSHNYAKYRLQQIQKKSIKYSKGLRGDLKTHTCQMLSLNTSLFMQM